ncbi:MAG TPA: ATP-binding protein [Ruminococcaceae bacterium]|nr:ATP-binding protein [Oscillospiraceae bacterium]
MPQIVLKAVVESIPSATEFMDALLEEYECNMRAQMQLDIAMDELFSNIAHYAYPNGEGDATVLAEFDEAQRIFSLTFIDSGVPYNPTEKEDPDITLSAEERSIGGLGIMMVRKTMDEMTYDYRDGKNYLTICKKI